MSTIGLTPVAAFVLRSLHDHPELRLPEAIVREAEEGMRFSEDDVRRGLDELHERGLAEHEAATGWRLTDAGKAA